MENKLNMDQEPNSSTNLVDTTPQANQLPIQQATSSQEMQPSVTGDIKKEKANKRLKVYGIVSLVFGCVVLVGYVLPYILFGENNLAVVYMAYAMIYRPIFWFGIITCVILFFLTLDNLVKYKIRLSIFVTMSIIGVLLAFSPLIYNGIKKIDDGELGTAEIDSTISDFLDKNDLMPEELILAGTQFNDIKPDLIGAIGPNLKIYDCFDDAMRQTCKMLNLRGGVGRKHK